MSVILALSQLFRLSYVKILSVLADWMIFTAVHELQTNKSHYRVCYDANLEYSCGYHLSFAILPVSNFGYNFYYNPHSGFNLLSSYPTVRFEGIFSMLLLTLFRVAI